MDLELVKRSPFGNDAMEMEGETNGLHHPPVSNPSCFNSFQTVQPSSLPQAVYIHFITPNKVHDLQIPLSDPLAREIVVQTWTGDLTQPRTITARNGWPNASTDMRNAWLALLAYAGGQQMQIECEGCKGMQKVFGECRVNNVWPVMVRCCVGCDALGENKGRQCSFVHDQGVGQANRHEMMTGNSNWGGGANAFGAPANADAVGFNPFGATTNENAVAYNPFQDLANRNCHANSTCAHVAHNCFSTGHLQHQPCMAAMRNGNRAMSRSAINDMKKMLNRHIHELISGKAAPNRSIIKCVDKLELALEMAKDIKERERLMNNMNKRW